MSNTLDFCITLPRRVVKQPSPAIVAGGDCGACCLAGLLGIGVKEAYDLQDPDNRSKDAKDTPVPFGWSHLSYVLECRSNGRVEATINDVPLWPAECRGFSAQFGFPGWDANLAWARYVRMALHGGYYGLCSISSGGAGPLKDHDHWVMICGIREVTVPNKTLPEVCVHTIQTQLLVSCSAKHPEGRWIDHLEFLRNHGGYNVILARPNTGEEGER